MNSAKKKSPPKIAPPIASTPGGRSLTARVLETTDSTLGHGASDLGKLEPHELFTYFLAPYDCPSEAIADSIRDCARAVHFGFRGLAADADDPDGGLFSDNERSMFFLTICRRLDILAELVSRMDRAEKGAK